MNLVGFVVICWVLALSSAFELTILHTNDVHARIEETDSRGGTCTPAKAAAGDCYGGVARRKTAINQLRAASNASLLLDGGDQFQGTLWFNVYKGSLTSVLMNKLGYDAMAFGNHEFDNGIAGVLPFLRNVTFPVLASNMDTSAEPGWPQNEVLFNRSSVKVVGGKKVGIIGYITTATPWLASPGPLTKFENEITAVKAEAARLKSLGVDIIIALGHAGIEVDKKLAESVSDLDVVIGGHTDTFLYTGTPPSREVPSGNYPLVINPTDKPSKKILVAQDYTFGKYLGHLKVMFDSQGEVVSYSGNPVLLNGSIAQDVNLLNFIDQYAAAVSNFSTRPIAHTHVLLDGERSSCRVRECNMGNMIADAFVAMNRRTPDSTKWADVAVALVNGGGIRASIDKPVDEYITSGDLKTVMPFGNTADIVEITGDTLLKTLEHSVTLYNPQDPAGRFLQVAGLQIVYNIKKPEGSRVVNVLVRCATCRIPTFEALNKTAVYKVLLPGFIASGGDAFTVLRDNIIQRHPGDVDVSYVTEYMRLETPLVTGLDKRITFATTTDVPCKPSGGLALSSQSVMVLLAALAGLVYARVGL